MLFAIEMGSSFCLDTESLLPATPNVVDYLADYEKYFFYSGRSALGYLVKALNPKGYVLLPEFICESVIKCFPSANIIFYKINNDFTIDCNDLLNKMNSHTSIFFLMHYFGALQPFDILCAIKKYAIENNITIIEDTTHSIFSAKQTIGDYMISSIRKWISSPNIGVLYSRRLDSIFPDCPLPKGSANESLIASVLKNAYLRREENNPIWDNINKEYRKMFETNEADLDAHAHIDYLGAPDVSLHIANCIDLEDLISSRQNNFSRLSKGLDALGIRNILDLKSNECPLVLPIRVDNRDHLRNYLADKHIYCAIHWPFDGNRTSERPIAIYNSQTLLSLPIDQRYNDTHIDYLLNVLSDYKGDLFC